jgi:hypothetical protein
MLDRIIHTCEEGKVSLNQHRSGVGDSVGYLGAEKVIGMLLHFKIKEFISFSLGIASPCLRCLRWLRMFALRLIGAPFSSSVENFCRSCSVPSLSPSDENERSNAARGILPAVRSSVP